MEHAFMYGPPGLDVDYCKLFMDSLEPAKDDDAQQQSDQQLFVPSPQTMLNASGDPYRLAQSVAVKDEPEEPAFGQYFGINNDMWSGPSDSSPSDQSVSVDLMDMLGSKQSYKSPSQDQGMDPQAVMFYPSPNHGQGVSPPHYQQPQQAAQQPQQNLYTQPQVIQDMAMPPQQLQHPQRQMPQQAMPSQQQSPHGMPSPPMGLNYKSPMDSHKIPAPMVSSGPASGAVSKRNGSIPASNGAAAARPRKSKSTHNLIEKRYRNNINDKINVLRDCVPSLRDCAQDGTGKDGLPAQRLNKATVLNKAAEYIQQLQRRNEALLKELNTLKAAKGMDMNQMPPLRSPQNEGDQMAYGAQDYSRPRSTSSISSVSSGSGRFSPSAKMAATCVVGGALTMGGMLGNEDLRGLAAVPLNLPFAPSVTLGGFAKVAAAMSLLATGVSLAQDRRITENRSAKLTQLSGDLQEHRQKAHKTACQMLEISSDTSVLGMVWNILVAMLQVIVLWCMGESMLNAFMELSGVDVRQRRALINQASNTELMGGSAGDLSTLRLMYLFVSQFLLPATPRRYVLQAMQAQELGYRSVFWPLYHALARGLWKRAKTCPPLSSREASPTPDYIDELVSRDLSEVMTPQARRAMRRMYQGLGMPTCRNYTFVVLDHGLTSASDILAAWAALAAQDAVSREFLLVEDPASALKALAQTRKLCPTGSLAEFRNEIIEAVYEGNHDTERIRAILNELHVVLRKHEWANLEGLPVSFYILLMHHHSVPTQASQAYAQQLAEEAISDKRWLSSPSTIIMVFLTLRQLAKDPKMRGMTNLANAAFICRQWFGKQECAGEFGFAVGARRRLIRESINMARFFGQA